MKINKLWVLGFSLFLVACSPKITTQITKNYAPLDYKEEIRVFGLNDDVPGKPEDLGTVKIGDTGFTTNCAYEVVVDAAKLEARKAGGNAVKIIEHILPSTFGSTCHRITAKILKVTDFNALPTLSQSDSTLAGTDFALIHVYRLSGLGPLISFDLNLDDLEMCRVKNHSKQTIRVRKEGHFTIWASTEVKREIPIDIKLGKEYYIRCGLTPGAFVGRPNLQLVSKEIGRSEYESIKSKKPKEVKELNSSDIIQLNDGRYIDCKIESEDSETIYFTLIKNGNEVKTHIPKSDIKDIRRKKTIK